MEWNDPECFRQFVYQPSVSRSLLLSPLSLSLSLSSSTLDQHQSSPPLAATLKRRSLTPSIEIFRVIRTNIFDHLRESIARIAERR